MRTIRSSADVLVIGGGPVGLATAVELGRWGISCIVADALDVPNGELVGPPRANHLNTRTMELFRRWGLATEIRSAGWPPGFALDWVFITGFRGHELARISSPPQSLLGAPWFSPEWSQRCPQHWLTPVLARAAGAATSVHLRYRTQIEEVRAVPGGVECRSVATDDRSAGDGVIRARFAVVADGAASGVRRQLGIDLEDFGEPVRQTSIVFDAPEFLAAHDMGAAAFYFVVEEKGPSVVLSPIDGRRLWRAITYDDRTGPMDLDSSRTFLADLLPPESSADVVSVSPWVNRCAVATSFRSGPFFLVGDAAHTLSPTGGLGLNTGVADAVDIGWKLAAVLQGWASPGLLDSFETERRSVAQLIVQQALEDLRYDMHMGGTFLDEASQRGELARRQFAEQFHRGAARQRWHPQDATLSLVYRGSPVIADDDSAPCPPSGPYDPYVASTFPGRRAPHVELPDGSSTLDLFGTGFVLIQASRDRVVSAGAAAIEAAAHKAGIPCRVAELADLAGTCYEEYPLVVIRPDGVVAWRGSSASAPEAERLWLTVTGGLAADQ